MTLKDSRVTRSFENDERTRCVDIVAHPDGGFGFQEWRCHRVYLQVPSVTALTCATGVAALPLSLPLPPSFPPIARCCRLHHRVKRGVASAP